MSKGGRGTQTFQWQKYLPLEAQPTVICIVAGKIKCFFSVTLPNIKSSITICLFNTLVGYLGLYGQTLALCDASNKDILVTPMMFIQKYLSGGVTYATQTGFFCACAILFGIVTIIFSTIQRVCCADRRKKTCFELKCNTYSKNKKLL